jgi:glycosyltransferase involved in cell wall biosynthesis
MTAHAVSVVIPTFQRPHLVPTAVRSVLDQTFADFEVVVVVDGRDEETMEALRALGDERLRVHVPDRHLGNADARNRGVALAVAPWVAFLDDDDRWLPSKLERQVQCLTRVHGSRPVVACRFIARSESGSMTWPRRLPRAGEDLSDYFFCRRTPFTGEGMVITSTILTSRELALEVPFTSGLRRHVDTDWLLRVAHARGFRLVFPIDDEPLAVWHVEHTRPRITTRRDWLDSLAWCRANRGLFTDRAYAAFLLHVVGSNAAAQHAWRALPALLREAAREGRPAPVDVAAHLANFVLPGAVQRHLAACYARHRGNPGARDAARTAP